MLTGSHDFTVWKNAPISFCLFAILVTILVIFTAVGTLTQVYADDENSSGNTGSSSSSDTSSASSSSSSDTSSASSSNRDSSTTSSDYNTNMQSDTNSSNSNANDTQTYSSTTSSTNDSNATENQNLINGTHSIIYTAVNHLTSKHHPVTSIAKHNLTKNITKHPPPLHYDFSSTHVPSSKSNLIMQLGHIIPGTDKIGYVGVEEKVNQTLLKLIGQGYLVSNIESTNELDNFSLSSWVKPDYSKGSDQFAIISKERAFTLGINNNILPHGVAEFSVFNGIKWITVQSKAKIDDTKWTHIAATFNGNTINLYVNGKMDSSLPVEGIPYYFPNGILGKIPVKNISSDSSLVIGAYREDSRGETFQQYSGKLCNLKLYNLSLTQSSINDIYQKEIQVS